MDKKNNKNRSSFNVSRTNQSARAIAIAQAITMNMKQFKFKKAALFAKMKVTVLLGD